MATNSDMELVRKAIKLLHSSHQDSATELRMMLDEAIKQRYGPEKMLCNTLSKRHLDEEKTFPGRAATPTPEQQQQPDADEVINLTNSPAKTISDSPNTIIDSEDGGGAGVSATMLTAGDDDVNLKEFCDLNCCVCGEMVFTATNRLIECSKCGTLYHQECHKPPITDEEASEDQEHNWQCDSCASKPSTSKAAGVVVIPDEPIALVASVASSVAKTKSSATSSRSSSSSNSSSSFAANFQTEQQPTATAAVATTAPTTTSRHHHKSSRSHREERPSSSSSKSSSSALNPTINIISAPDKVVHSSSKRSSSHSSSSKSSSSKSSSRHHEGSSSKRKSSK